MRVIPVAKSDYNLNRKILNSKNVVNTSFCANGGGSDLQEVANHLFELGQRELPFFLSTLRDIAGDLPLLYRVKKPYSILSKIDRAKIAPHRPFVEYKEAVNDLLGATIISNSDKTTEKIVDNLIMAIKAKKINILKIKNNTQSDLPYYLSPEHINKIHAANQQVGLERMLVINDDGIDREDGYIGTNILGQTANGCSFEEQIKGANVRNIDIGFHIPWSILSNGKVIVPSEEAANLMLKPLESACLSLTPSQVDGYNRYQRAAYKAARENELGLQREYPQLPDSLPAILDFNNVTRIHKQVVG